MPLEKLAELTGHRDSRSRRATNRAHNRFRIRRPRKSRPPPHQLVLAAGTPATTSAPARSSPPLRASTSSMPAPLEVGIDCANIDNMKDPARPALTIFFAAGIPIVEHLRGLDQLEGRDFRFFATPPAIEGGTSFPSPRSGHLRSSYTIEDALLISVILSEVRRQPNEVEGPCVPPRTRTPEKIPGRKSPGRIVSRYTLQTELSSISLAFAKIHHLILQRQLILMRPGNQLVNFPGVAFSKNPLSPSSLSNNAVLYRLSHPIQ